MAIAVVIIIGLAADLGVEKSQADSSSAVGAATCTTPGCIDASAEILSHLDESIDPCEDINQFACNGFAEEQILPFGTCGTELTLSFKSLVAYYT